MSNATKHTWYVLWWKTPHGRVKAQALETLPNRKDWEQAHISAEGACEWLMAEEINYLDIPCPTCGTPRTLLEAR